MTLGSAQYMFYTYIVVLAHRSTILFDLRVFLKEERGDHDLINVICFMSWGSLTPTHK